MLYLFKRDRDKNNLIKMRTNEFKQIPGYTNYEVNRMGEIRRIGGKSPLRTSMNNKGYLQIKVDNTSLRPHRAVALAWIGVPEDPNMMVNHKDEIRTNNNVDNLEWTTNRENLSHSLLKKDKSSKYIGVSWNKSRSKWKAQIRIDGKVTFLGYHDSEEDARNAYLRSLSENGLTNKYTANPTRWERLTTKINDFLTKWN